MTPTAFQALAPAAQAPTDAARRAAPGDEPVAFATVLGGSVQALSGDAEQARSVVDDSATIEVREEPGAEAGLVQAGPEVGALAGHQPRLDALALMLATAPAPPGQTTPDAAAAAVAIAAAAAPGAPALAAHARGPLGGTAVAISRPVSARALAAHPNDGEGALAPAALTGSTRADAAPDAERAAAGTRRGAQRHEGDAMPVRPRQVAAIAAAEAMDRTEAATNARAPTAAPATATMLLAAAGTQRAPQGAPATIGKAGGPAASAATPAAAQGLSANPERAPLAMPAAAPLQPEAIPAQDASPAPAPAPAPIDVPAPAVALAAGSAPATPGAVGHVAPPVGSPDWAPALAQQLVRLPGGGAVELHLNPVELGPLQVRLSVVDGQAQVLFVADHAAVRQALEAALPQLRTSLAENGISLGQANVGSGAAEQRAGQDGGDRPAPGSEREARARADEPASEPEPRRPYARANRDGAVDTFA